MWAAELLACELIIASIGILLQSQVISALLIKFALRKDEPNLTHYETARKIASARGAVAQLAERRVRNAN